jgi:hypothetical protein
VKNIISKALFSILLVTVSSANAGIISTYSDRTTFDNAVGTTTIEDFTDSTHYPLSSGVLNSSSTEAGLVAGDIESGVTYSTTIGTGNFFNIDAGGGYTGGMLDSAGGDHELTITLDNSISAFGFDTNQLMGSLFDIVINFSSGGSTSLQFSVAQSLNMEFFGFQSSLSDIDSVLISGNDQTFNFIIDNFAFGGSSSINVPEPSIIALLGFGLAGLGFARRRKMKA